MLPEPKKMISFLLAQSPPIGLPDPTSPFVIGWLLVGLVALLTGLNQGHDMIKKLTGKGDVTRIEPNPLQIQAAAEYVLRREYTDAIAKIWDEHKRLDDLVRHDMARLHEKVNALSNDMAGMKASNDALMRQLVSISSKLDRNLERQVDHGT